ncbi:TraA family conjugative transfer protein, partial [Vibrio breoganii]
SLGKGIAIAFVMVGIVMGVVRQSLMAFAIGVGAALGLNYTPTIIGNLFTAIL